MKLEQNPKTRKIFEIPVDKDTTEVDKTSDALTIGLDKQTLHQWFESQVRLSAKKTALIHRDRNISYHQLNSQANQLANKLSLNTEQTVVLYLDPSVDMVVAILAVLKAGGAYIPISTDMPTQRIRTIVKQSNAKGIVTNIKYKNQLSAVTNNLYLIDDKTKQNADDLKLKSNRHDLCYVMYTSGTSGEPKGVMIEHQSMVNLVQHHQSSLGFNQAQTVLSLVPYQSDAFGEMLFTTLLSGNTLVLCDRQVAKDKKAISDLILSHQVSLLHGVSSHLAALGDMRHLTCIQQVVFGGESPPIAILSHFNARLVNEYGPTETTVTATQCLDFGTKQDLNTIGKPVAGVQVYILNEHLERLASPEIGQLYIGGVGLARGYINNQALTDEYFIDSPFGRLYRTGDLARVNHTGELIYCGREDAQVKVRGYRVELSEINNTIASFEAVQDAIVLQIKEPRAFLAAYIVVKDSFELLLLKNRLATMLPHYMMPDCFVQIDSMPLTDNGKIDRSKLPKAQLVGQFKPVKLVSQAQKVLAKVWQSLLPKSDVTKNTSAGNISADSHFLLSGGDSLLAMRMIAGLESLGYELNITDIFTTPVLADLALKLRPLAKSEQPNNATTSIAQLSSAQQSLLILEQLSDQPSSYQLPVVLRLSEDADVSTLRKHISILISRHESLNVCYKIDEQGQYYKEEIEHCLESRCESIEDVKELKQRIEQELAIGFDLSIEASIRLRIYELGSERYLLLMFHHIGFDGPSLAIFMDELAQLYQGKFLPKKSIDYFAYHQWQHNRLVYQQQQSLSDFWLQQLKGFSPLSLPYDKPKKHYHGQSQSLSFKLSSQLTEALKQTAINHDMTVNSVLLSGFYIALSVYCDQQDIVVGMPSDKRLDVDSQAIIGLMINTLALRTQVDSTQSLLSFMKQVQNTVLLAKAHQALPFEQVVQLLSIERSLAQNPIFQVMFSYEQFEQTLEQVLEHNALPFEAMPLNLAQTAMFDIHLSITDKADRFEGELKYDPTAFDADSIAALSRLFNHVLPQLTADLTIELGQLHYLSNIDKQVICPINRVHATNTNSSETLHGLFEQQVLKAPDAIALQFNLQQWTYRQLNEEAETVASHLNIKPQSTVAIFCNRGPKWVIAILAVLKAGGNYVPLSIDFPNKRINFILSDTQASVVLCEHRLMSVVTECIEDIKTKPQIVEFEEVSKDINTSYSKPKVLPQHLAYILYTSGTTGWPKGVMVEHGSVVNTVKAMSSVYDISAEFYKVGCFSEFVFDVSISEMFNSLGFGGQLHLFDDNIRKNPDVLIEYVIDEQINYLFVPPALLSVLPQREMPSLKAIIFAGESCNVNQCRYFAENFGLYNFYGPTEAAIYACGKQAETRNLNEIGKPLPGVELYVLNQQMQQVPVGIRGELYIGGNGLARGYLNLAQLTQDKFVTSEFGRLYKTGDIVRYMADGHLAYIGRNDHQVKIRGVRIELAEIEQVISTIDGVQQALVVDRQYHSETLICAYVVGQSFDIEHIKAVVEATLPATMMPSTFTQLDALPLNINGKIERNKLPSFSLKDEQKTVAPINHRQRVLCQLFAEVLPVETVGIHDNFFSCGGNSINAVRLIALIAKRLALKVELALLFEYQTVAQLALHIGDEAFEAITPVQQKRYPLTYPQQRLLFIERMAQGSSAYHMPYLLELDSDCNTKRLVEAINAVCNRHQVLKSIFVRDENEQDYFQSISDDLPLVNHVVACQSSLEQQFAADLNLPFDLATSPPVRLYHYQLDSTQYFMVVFHHIAFDGWSIDLFVDELSQFYLLIEDDVSPAMTPLSISYGDYALWLQQTSYLQALHSLEDFWRNQLLDFEPLELPLDKTRPKQFDYKGDNYRFVLDKTTSDKLKTLAIANQTTLYNVLLSGFYITISGLSGQQDIVVGSPSDNRQHLQTQDLIGFFVNALALRCKLDTDWSVAELIKQVGLISTGAKAHQDMPFEQLVERLKLHRSADRHPVFQVMFTVQDFERNAQVPPSLPFKNIGLEQIQHWYAPAKFDLTTFIAVEGEQIVCDFNYATSLFHRGSIERLATLFTHVVQQMARCKDLALKDLSLVSPEVQRRLITLGKPQSKDSAVINQTIDQLFAKQVALTPDKVALRSNDKTLTYQQLNQKAQRLSVYLGEGQTVALYLERSVEMIIAMLAVLKAGGTYVPVSKHNPTHRRLLIINDSQSQVLIVSNKAQDSLTELLKQGNNPVRVVDLHNLENTVSQQPVIQGHSNNQAAYILYTSGTTGTPKGVIAPHKAVITLVSNNGFLVVDNDDVILHLSDPGFDAATFEIWGALLNGATLIVPEQNTSLDAPTIEAIYSKYKVTISWLTRALLDALYHENPKLFANLRALLSGGEALTSDVVTSLCNSEYRPELFFNGYGPTEGTTFTTIWPYSADHSTIPIGRPFHSREIYILDQHNHLAPIGAVGELYIGGEGLALGYHNRPELTAQKFVETAFGRLYHSGDLARWSIDGELLFLGRNDNQLKLRGFRIEPGEIEAVLASNEAIEQACIVQDQQQRLIAYCKLTNQTEDESVLIVNDWEKLYDDLYAKEDDEVDTFDIGGWHCSFSNQPIAKDDMAEWVEQTVNRIQSLGSKHLLEVGFGSGLLLYRLVDQLEQYHGLDFSTKVVGRVKSAIKQLDITNAEVEQGEACQIHQFDHPIDTIVINSVTQYFPSLDYLDNVIKGCLDKIEQGSIFIGDVRDLRLLPHFQQAKGRFGDEQELLIDPNYFVNLAQRFKKVSHVQILAKRGHAKHEMNLYRYDVVLTVNQLIDDAEVTVEHWHEQDLSLLKSPTYIQGYPNKRLNKQSDVLCVEQLHQLARQCEFNLLVLVSLSDSQLLDLVFVREATAGIRHQAHESANVPMTNQPSINRNFDFAPIKAFAEKQLPDYMVPWGFVEVEQFKLNVNGKIDLAELAGSPLNSRQPFAAPDNDIESLLVQVWQKVLAITPIGIDDNYFELGGNSINAIRICSACSEALSQEVSISALFEHQSIRQLAIHLGGHVEKISHIEQQRYPLSYSQRQLFVLSQFSEAQWAFHNPCLVKLQDTTDVNRLERGLNQLINRHAVLSTVIEQIDDEYYQKLKPQKLVFNWHQLDDDAPLFKTVKEYLAKPFDLCEQSPFKVIALTSGQNRYLLLLWHHIGFDGWSADIFLSELTQLYQGKTLEALAITYGDYALWQQNLTYSAELAYWQKQLDGYTALQLPLKQTRPKRFDYQGKLIEFSLDSALSEQLRYIAKVNQTTLYNVLLSGFYVALSTLSGQRDIVIGTPSDNRNQAELQKLIGFFVNVLPLRIDVDSHLSVNQLLANVHQMMVDAKRHQQLPFEKLVEHLDPQRDASCHPIFQVLFSLQSFGEELSDSLPFEILPSGQFYQPAKFDIDLLMSDAKQQISGQLSFATSLYDLSTIRLLIDIYQQVLATMVLSDDRKLGALYVYQPPVQSTFIQSDGHLVTLFEQCAKQHFDKTALIVGKSQLSYQQLNRRANALASRLQSNALIALYLEPSINTIVAILAVMKAGSAYVPIDTDYPKARIEFILSDTNAVQVIAEAKDSKHFKDSMVVEPSSEELVDFTSQSNSLAYVMYTSGTTGNPKGVMVEHYGIVNLIESQTKAFGITEDEHILLLASYVFDASVEQMWLALLNGATLSVATKEQVKTGDVLTPKITHLHGTPAYLSLLDSDNTNLRRVISGGDVCTDAITQKFGSLLINEYGPTEATVTSLQSVDCAADAANNIGKPIDNVQVYVLNALGKPALVGELYIGGAGVAKGYLNHPDLTEQRFVETTFGRLYRTGDKVRYQSDGSIVFLGRLDQQIQLRGLRIEPNEIESCLNRYVDQSLVTVEGQGQHKYLCAFVVTHDFNETVLLEQLSKQLPKYMVPTRIVPLTQLPLTPSGKPNFNAIGKIVAEFTQDDSDCLTQFEVDNGVAITPVQKQLKELWQSSLNVKTISINDNFFRLGGNSLSAVKLCQIMSRELGIEISLSLLFECQTIKTLSLHLAANLTKQSHTHQINLIEAIEDATSYPLSFSQSRMLFLQSFYGQSNLNHIHSLVKLSAQTDITKLQVALAKVVARHPVLKSVYQEEAQSTVGEFTIEKVECEDWYSQAIKDCAKPFDLSTEPGFRAHLYLGEPSYLLFVWHHIAFDGYSAQIFAKELALAYDNQVLEPLAIHYGDYAYWQRQGERVEADANFWQQQLSDMQSLALATDKPRPKVVSHHGEDVPFTLDGTLSLRLRQLASELEVSLYTVLLSGFYLLLSKMTGQTDIIVGTPSDNRDNQTLDLIGLFANSLVLRSQIDPEHTPADFIQSIQRTVLEAKRHQALPFEQLLELLDIQRDSARHPIFQVMFSTQPNQHINYENLPFESITFEQNANSAKFDLTLIVAESEQIEGIFNYATALFDRQSIDRLASYYLQVLQSLVKRTEQPILRLPDISRSDVNQLIEWGYGGEGAGQNDCFYLLFEQMATHSPEALAVGCQNTDLSYKQLNERANQLARIIDVNPGSVVALYLGRSINLIVAILAVMKAGGAYVPITKNSPRHRVKYILKDTQTSVVITESDCLSEFDSVRVIDVLAGAEQPVNNVDLAVTPSQRAYILYTSGTSGKPKGVVMSHGSFAGFLQNAKSAFDLAQTHCFSLTDYTFDIFGLEFGLPLISGGQVILSQLDWPLPDIRKVNLIQQTPSMWQAFFNQYGCNELPKDLNLLVGGESVQSALFDKLALLSQKVYQVYGPTETCIWSSFAKYQRGQHQVIGQAFSGETLLILDSHNQLCPIGGIGQLCIKGDGLSQGYLNLPELTDLSFVNTQYGRVYLSGDKARWNNNGQIEFLGRIDQQVKIRGHRVETTEIASLISQQATVKQCAVIKHNEGLAAFVVSDQPEITEQLPQLLSPFLPSYMIPQWFSIVSAIPLNNNGKLAIDKLPTIHQSDQLYVEPVTELEHTLCHMWQQVLNVERVGLLDNFFSLGGHSINALALKAQIKRQLGLDLALDVLFEQPTIAATTKQLQTVDTRQIEHKRHRQYPLSFAQQRLWFVEQFNQDSSAYHIPCLFKLDSHIDIKQLTLALSAILQRHQVLTSVFDLDHQASIEYRLRLEVTVTHGMDDEISTLIEQPFNLEHQVPVRFNVLEQNNNQYLLAVWHHIAFDGWSLKVFTDELEKLYGGQSLEPLPIQYGDYALWQQEQLDTADTKAYWLNQLEGFENLQLPVDFKRPKKFNHQGADIERVLAPELVNQLKQLAKTEQTTLYTVMLSSFFVTLSAYCGQKDVLIGTPNANREQNQTHQLIGMFVNALAIRVNAADTTSVSSFIKQVHQTVVKAKRHATLGFEQLIDLLDVKRDPSRHPIFAVMFSLEQLNVQPEDAPFKLVEQGEHYTPAKFDLNMTVLESESRVTINLNYATALFRSSTIERLLNLYVKVLYLMTDNTQQRIGELAICPMPKPVNLPLIKHDLIEQFENQAARCADNTALVFQGQSLNYAQLNASANQLAKRLPQGERIGLFVERGFDTVVSILAVLKAGSAYVPIAVDYPQSRIDFILADSNAALVITNLDNSNKFNNAIVIEEPLKTDRENPNIKSALAYVMYTSGTTGKPKGVVVERSAIVNLIEAQTQNFGFNAQEQVLLLASYVFDASVEQMWLALLNGATLHIASEEQVKSADVFKPELTHLHATPSYLQLLSLSDEHRLKRVISGGQECPQTLVEQYGDLLINEYGPTEATVTALQCIDYAKSSENCIGKPLNNIQAFVLNDIGRPALVGELYLGGAGLAKEYWQQPDLTEKQFITTEFGRLYRTGDKVRQLPDNSFEFLGRIDNQIKLRGQRIEPAEIQSVLNQYVQQSLVTVSSKDDDKYLIAYVVCDDFDAVKLTQALHQQLPNYMVPSKIVQIDEIPLNNAAKVDLKRLKQNSQLVSGSVQPSTPLEKTIYSVWQEYLSTSDFGIHDNFFSLGGNSLSAIKLCKTLSERLKINVPVSSLFDYQTIGVMAANLNLTNEQQTEIKALNQTTYPVSSSQARLLFINQFEQNSAYHVPCLFKLEPSADVNKLQSAFNQLLKRHRVLSSVFCDSKQVYIETEVSLNIETVNKKLIGINKALTQPFDLREETPMRVKLYRQQNEDYLLIIWHHIAVDAWSTRLFFDELAVIYQGQTPNTSSIEYGDYAQWQQNQPTDPQSLNYWLKQLDGIEALVLPSANLRPKVTDYEGSTIQSKLPTELVKSLKQLAKDLNTSYYTVMLSGFYICLGAFSGQKDIVIGATTDNRSHHQTHGLIGLFINLLALRANVDGNLSIQALIKQVQQTVLEGKLHQALPFEDVVTALDLANNPSHHPIFQVMFNLESGSQQSLEQLPFEPIEIEYSKMPAKFDITMTVFDTHEQATLNLNYATSLYNQDFADSLMRTYCKILQSMIENSQSKIAAVDLLDKQSKEKLEAWKTAKSSAALQSTSQTVVNISQQFDLSVTNNSLKTAIEYQGQSLTYQELSVRVNALARLINVKCNDLVVLYFERSAEMIIAMLAVLKAGGAFVPVGVKDPKARVAHILTETKARLVLTQSCWQSEFNDIKAIAVDQIDCCDNTMVTCPAVGEDLAYVIYTSGSTGQPKGVMIEQQNLINYANALKQKTSNIQGRVDFSTHYCFDLSVTTSLCPLLSGGTVCIYSGDVTDVAAYHQHLAQINVDLVKMTPTMAHLLLPEQSCKTLIVGGEVLSSETLNTLKTRVAEIFDEYGPTETTIGASVARVWPKIDSGIGKPYAKVQALILNEQLNLLPVGAFGELHIGGHGVGRGYLAEPLLTKEKFVQTKFGRLYKTGDIVSWDHHGNLIYHTRKDTQVKIRGHRIELNEVQSAIQSTVGVSHAAVIEKQGRIAAYFVSSSVAAEPQIKQTLDRQLPDYMLPESITELDRLPMTLNGKLNTQALPEPQWPVKQYVAPQSRIQKHLCNIWQNLLGIDRIGIDDDFFECGGNSILVMQAIQAITKQLGLSYSIKQLYMQPTIRQLTGHQANDELLSVKIETAQFKPLVKANMSNEHISCVFVTGATGFIGAYVLESLLSNTEFKVYCLVRSKTKFEGMSQLKSNMQQYNIWQPSLDNRIEVVLGDISVKNLGLSETDYLNLAANTGYIYHCATSMNHLATYDQLKQANVDGTYEILKLACHTLDKKVEYLSTTGIFTSGTFVQESSDIDEQPHYRSGGYNASKWVAEKLVMQAQDAGIDVSIHRLNLVVGDSKTLKAPQSQWLTKLIRSCHQVNGCFNSAELQLNISHVDFIAQTIVQLSLNQNRREIYHLEHPNPVAFVDLVKQYNKNNKQALDLISHQEFIARIKQTMQSGYNVPIAYMIDELWQTNKLDENVESSKPLIDSNSTHEFLAKADLKFTDLSTMWRMIERKDDN